MFYFVKGQLLPEPRQVPGCGRGWPGFQQVAFTVTPTTGAAE
jgi:hypothetical protein